MTITHNWNMNDPNPPDRFIRDPNGAVVSEAIWDTIPDEPTGDGWRFEYKECANGYVLVNDDNVVSSLVVHQEVGPSDYVMGWPV